MWKQGARSSALDRAQALLSAKKSTREEAECVRGPTGNTVSRAPRSSGAPRVRVGRHPSPSLTFGDVTFSLQGAVGGSLKTKPASLNTRPVFSDLSDLSSISSAPEPDGGDRTQARNGLSSKVNDCGSFFEPMLYFVQYMLMQWDFTNFDSGTILFVNMYSLRQGLRPQSSPGEGGSRFLKKAPPTPIISDHSPVSKSQVQRVPEHRYR